MKKIYSLLILLAVALTLGFAEEEKYKIVKKDNFTYRIDIDTTGADIESKLTDHTKKILSLYDSCKSLQKQLSKRILKPGEDTVKVRYADGRYEYRFQENRNDILSVKFDKSHLIRNISFRATGGRNFTREERREFNRTGKIPDSFRNITEDEAIKMAEELHRFVYGDKEHNKFDSITIKQHGQDYGVYFSIKVKNDIRDSRHSQVSVDANSGEITRFYCEGLNHTITFDYTPKITKVQAIQMYNAEVVRLNADIDIREMYLQKYPDKKGESRWAWLIYGNRRDKNLYHSAILFIDSETGEVLANELDY